MPTYLGDYVVNEIVNFKWSTNDSNGAACSRDTNGTISVYKANGTTQSTAGITDTEDFDGLTGVHHCRIDLGADTDFYASGADYQVVLSGAVIDGETVNATIGHFSIGNRSRSAGSGADRVTITLLDGNGNPIADADVWITSDESGHNIVAGTRQTNSQGSAVFYLDAGQVYYRFAQKDGVTFDNPQSFVASADV